MSIVALGMIAAIVTTGVGVKTVENFGTRAIRPVDVVRLDLAASASEGCSLADFCRRAEVGERLTVVFHGGSLTWGANATDPNRKSWRALVGAKLEARYPKARFKFIDAANGTRSGSKALIPIRFA